jgi:hypothetical protein
MMKEILLPSSCLGCALRLVAFRGRTIVDESEPEWSSLYITELSDHSHLYRNSWRGRLKFAWDALRGKPQSDIGCETLDEIKALHEAIGQIIEFVEKPNEVSKL